MSVIGWIPMESLCMECRNPIIRDVPGRRFCTDCAEKRKVERQKILRERMYPNSKKRKTTVPNKYYLTKRKERLEYQAKYTAEHREEISIKQKARYQKMKEELKLLC